MKNFTVLWAALFAAFAFVSCQGDAALGYPEAAQPSDLAGTRAADALPVNYLMWVQSHDHPDYQTGFYRSNYAAESTLEITLE
ncbi:MAG: hypothetical protein LUE10_06675, partial [Alistipes sp.]|nr:hypothetical protein [Alistipes sp.]